MKYLILLCILLKIIKLDSFLILSDFEDNEEGGKDTPLVFDYDHIFTGRWGGETLYSEKNDSVFFMFSYDKDDDCNDVWEFSVKLKQWTYRKGDCGDILNYFVKFRDYNDSNTPQRRRWPRCFFSSSEKKTIICTLGKYSTNVLLSDLWEYDIRRNMWRILRVDSPGNYTIKGKFDPYIKMGGRYSTSIWVLEDSVFFFSGDKVTYTSSYSDMWELKLSNLYFKWVHGPSTLNTATDINDYPEKGVYNISLVPRGRRHGNTWINKKEGLLYLFSGQNTIRDHLSKTLFLEDLFVFSINETSWKWIGGSLNIRQAAVVDNENDFSENNFPGSPASASIFPYSDKYTFLFGGYNDDDTTGLYVLDNTWLYNSETNQWKFISGSKSKSSVSKTLSHIGSRAMNGFVKISDNQFLVIGGFNQGSPRENDVWKFTVSECGTTLIHEEEKTLCNGKGECIKKVNDVNHYLCKCYNETIYSGIECEIYTEPPDYTMLYVIIISISVITCIAFSILFCCFLLISIFLCRCVCVLYSNQLKLAQIKDVDKVLVDQENDEKSDVMFNINKKLFEINYNNIKLIKKIDSGGSDATVYKASWNGIEVAIKLFKVCTFTSQGGYEEFEKEISIMGSISHPNILNFYGATLQLPKLGIVMELCEGELGKYIKKGIKFNEKIRICKGIVSAMEYLHNRDIIHRDLKSDNILVDKKKNPKLIDFGLSRIIEKNKKSKMTVKIGTAFYMSPEITLGQRYDQRTDVFSFGIILWEIMHNDTRPYDPTQDFNVEVKVATNPSFRPKIDESKFNEQNNFLIEQMKQCWAHNYEDRPQFMELRGIFEKRLKK